MSDEREESAAPVGTRVVLGCGHRIRLPWDLAPEAAIADLLQHEALCPSDPTLAVPRGMLPPDPAWLPFPAAHR